MKPLAAAGPLEMTIAGGNTISIKDVLVGEVWVGSGQSNMEFGLSMSKDGAAEVQAADRPNIRLYVAPRQFAYHPLPVDPGEWKVCTPQTVKENGWGGFSAVGYYFARELQDRLKVHNGEPFSGQPGV